MMWIERSRSTQQCVWALEAERDRTPGGLERGPFDDPVSYASDCVLREPSRRLARLGMAAQENRRFVGLALYEHALQADQMRSRLARLEPDHAHPVASASAQVMAA